MVKGFQDPQHCCGCAACADICPCNAISMTGKDGFDYPEINEELCVECGLCEKVCVFAKNEPAKSCQQAAYACKNKESVRMKSSSGGIFTALSDEMLGKGGVVYGACFDGTMVLRHKRAATSAQRDAMRGSKYIQSDMAGVHRQVKEDVKANVPVLFVGTPCQVAGLKSFLGRDYENLLTVDVICHGVPSPELWRQFVDYINEKYDANMAHYAFRNKQVSWRRYSPVVCFDDGRVIGENKDTGAFVELFRYDVCMRPSCAVCPYASMDRQGDITIGDFWGIEKVQPQMDDGKGVSAVLVNTEKGVLAMKAAENDLELTACTPEQISAGQPNLHRPSQPSNKAAAFQQDWKSMPFEGLLKKYTRVGFKRRVIDLIKKILGR